MNRFISRAMISVLLCSTAGYFAPTRAAPVVLPLKRESQIIIQAFALSPNGKELAEEVRPLTKANERVVILVRSLRDPKRDVRVIYSGVNELSHLQWASNQRVLFVRPGKVAQVISVDVANGTRTVLFQRKGGISGIVYDRKSRDFAYEYAKKWRWGKRVSVRVKPSMDVMELIEPRWSIERFYTTYIGVRQPSGRQGRREVRRELHVKKFREVFFNAAPVLAWRAGRLLAIKPAAQSIFRTHIVDANSGQQIPGQARIFREFTMAVSPNGRIAVAGINLWRDGHKTICGCSGSLSLDVLDPNGGIHRVSSLSENQRVAALSAIWWAGNDRVIVEVETTSGSKSDDFDGPQRWSLEEVDWRTNQVIRSFGWPDGDLGDWTTPCSLDAKRTVAICVAQTLSEPPRLVQVDLTTGKMRDLGNLNPRQRQLGFRFSKVRVPSAFGSSSTGFLALPADARKHSVPLAVMLYGFDEAYSRHAQWITSYPVAKFVRSGIAVLMLNWAYLPGLTQSYYASKEKMRSALTTIANALPAVRAIGVRINRAMVMGWSFGGLFTALAIQKLHEYVAAQVGDPAAYNTTEYALGNDMWSNFADMWFGGPPIRKYIKHYLRFDPAAAGRPANGPILLEFVSSNLDAGQYLQEWRAVGTQVEAFAYRRSVHWLNVPAEAAISRRRNLYWAKMNLFGPASVSCAALRSVGLTVPKHGWWNRSPVAEKGPNGRHGQSCRSVAARPNRR